VNRVVDISVDNVPKCLYVTLLWQNALNAGIKII